MPRTTLDSLFLTAFNADLGLWESVMLGSPVSPLSVEAMNLILLRDGILAYIGTREESGHYVQALSKETGKVTPFSWISYPGHTLHAILGLRRSTGVTERPEMVFYGSPLTVLLMVCLHFRKEMPDIASSELEYLLKLRGIVQPVSDNGFVRGYFIRRDAASSIVALPLGRYITSIELDEAMGYLDPSPA